MQRCVRLIEPTSQLTDFFRQRLDILTGRLGFADRLGPRVAVRAKRLDLDLQRLTLCFEREEVLTVEHEAPPREIPRDPVEIVP